MTSNQNWILWIEEVNISNIDKKNQYNISDIVMMKNLLIYYIKLFTNTMR